MLTQLDNIVEEFSQLNLENQEYIVNILQNQVREKKREIFLAEVTQAESNFKNGSFKSGNIDDLLADIDDD